MKRKKVTEELKEIWKKRYLAGETARDISKDYQDFHESTISRHIKQMGISRNRYSFKTTQIKEQVKNDFLSNEYYCEDLAKKYKVDVHTIYKILDGYNIERKTGTKSGCDENYFSVIDNPHKAYLIGFITADGAITGKYHGCCSIEIDAKDKDLLTYACQQINPDAKISYLPKKNNVKVTFNSVKLCNDLKQYNIVPNKSKIIQSVPIQSIPQKYLKYYFRGLIDGDGCIHKNGKVSIFSGSLPYITSVQNILCQEAGVKKLGIYHGTSYFIAWSSKRDREKLFNYLYQDSLEDCFYYKRKYERLYNSLYENTEVTN